MLTFLSTGDRLAARALRSARRSTGHLGQLAKMTGAAVKSEVSDSNTGDWRFDADTHTVRLGNRFHTNIVRPMWSGRGSFLKANDKHAIAFAAQILRHEKWHGLATVRDVPALAAACRRDGVPFAVLNVLEDIRIEFKAWTVERTWFEWVRWIEINPASNAIHAILNMKMGEHTGTWGARWATSDTDLDDLKTFFEKARNAPDSWAIVKLAKEFVERFGVQEPPPELVKGGLLHDDIGGERDGSAGDTATRGTPIPDAPSAESDAHVEVDDSGEVVIPKGTPKTNAAQVHWTEFTGARYHV